MILQKKKIHLTFVLGVEASKDLFVRSGFASILAIIPWVTCPFDEVQVKPTFN